MAWHGWSRRVPAGHGFFDSDGLSDGSIPSAVFWLGGAVPGLAGSGMDRQGESGTGKAWNFYDSDLHGSLLAYSQRADVVCR